MTAPSKLVAYASRASVTAVLIKKVAGAGDWEAPTARNSNLLPVKATGEVRFLSVESLGKAAGPKAGSQAPWMVRPYPSASVTAPEIRHLQGLGTKKAPCADGGGLGQGGQAAHEQNTANGGTGAAEEFPPLALQRQRLRWAGPVQKQRAGVVMGHRRGCGFARKGVASGTGYDFWVSYGHCPPAQEHALPWQRPAGPATVLSPAKGWLWAVLPAQPFALVQVGLGENKEGGHTVPYYGLTLPQDTGGAIKGNRIDLFCGAEAAAPHTAGFLNTKGAGLSAAVSASKISAIAIIRAFTLMSSRGCIQAVWVLWRKCAIPNALLVFSRKEVLMFSILDLFKTGIGPSSSHTLGPMLAAGFFVAALQEGGLLAKVSRLAVSLHGSLALTGVGHHTDLAVMLGLAGETPANVSIEGIPAFIGKVRTHKVLPLACGAHQVCFDPQLDIVFAPLALPEHENGLCFCAYAGEAVLLEQVWYSVGGGVVVQAGQRAEQGPTTVVPYPYRYAAELLAHCRDTGSWVSGPLLLASAVTGAEAVPYTVIPIFWAVARALPRLAALATGNLPSAPAEALAAAAPSPSKSIQGTGQGACVAWVLHLVKSQNQGQGGFHDIGEQSIYFHKASFKQAGHNPLAATCIPDQSALGGLLKIRAQALPQAKTLGLLPRYLGALCGARVLVLGQWVELGGAAGLEPSGAGPFPHAGRAGRGGLAGFWVASVVGTSVLACLGAKGRSMLAIPKARAGGESSKVRQSAKLIRVNRKICLCGMFPQYRPCLYSQIKACPEQGKQKSASEHARPGTGKQTLKSGKEPEPAKIPPQPKRACPPDQHPKDS
ncbi:hypothetical protein B566_EDAN018906, partial [Ephemera danica]